MPRVCQRARHAMEGWLTSVEESFQADKRKDAAASRKHYVCSLIRPNLRRNHLHDEKSVSGSEVDASE